MMRLLLFVVLVALGHHSSQAQHRCWGDPEPFRWVYDEAELLDYSTEARVQVGLEQFNQAYGVVLILYLAPDLCGWSSLGFATVLGSDWGVGDAQLDNGLVMMISPKNEVQSGGVALSVGKGLEMRLTDAEAQGIIDGMIPQLKNKEWYAALVWALNQGLPAALTD